MFTGFSSVTDGSGVRLGSLLISFIVKWSPRKRIVKQDWVPPKRVGQRHRSLVSFVIQSLRVITFVPAITVLDAIPCSDMLCHHLTLNSQSMCNTYLCRCLQTTPHLLVCLLELPTLQIDSSRVDFPIPYLPCKSHPKSIMHKWRQPSQSKFYF
jgi:hypothetical protein